MVRLLLKGVLHIFLIGILVAGVTGKIFAQTTIWEENFDGYSDGAVSGTASGEKGTTWGIDVSQANLSGSKSYFEVRSLYFEGRYVRGVAQWLCDPIDLSGFEDITVSSEIWKSGGTMEPTDSINFYYRLDGGAWQAIALLNDDISTSPQTYSVNSLNGATLELRFDIVLNNGSAERYAFDNINVTGTSLPPTVSLSVDKTSITEAGEVATITATLDHTYSQDVTVYLSYAGDALNNADYSISSDSITVPAGSLTETARITAVDDCVVEGDETVTVDITSVTNGTENGTQQVVTTIVDNDVYPTISLLVDNSTIVEDGGSSIVTVALSSTFCQDITVWLDLSTGTAFDGSDFSYTSGSITIPSGSLSGTITVSAINDYLVEGDETVVVKVGSTNVSGISTTVSPVSITITDDDLYTITVSPVSGLTTTESGGTATFTIVLNAITYYDVTISLTSNDTSEGTVSPTSVVFDNSNFWIPQTITVTGVDDAFVDGDISYTITTGAAVSFDSNYSGQDPADVSVTNTDNDVSGGGIWLRADAGTSTTTDGGSVTSWLDQAGSNDATSQSTAPTYQALGWNFNPTISFSSGYYHSANNGVSDDMTLGSVFSTTQSFGNSSFWNTPAIIGCETASVQNDYTLSMNYGQVYFKGIAGNDFGAQTTSSYNDGIPHIVVATRQKSSTGLIEIYIDGILSASAASDNVSLNDPPNFGIGNHSSPTSGGQFVGNIGEVFVDGSVFSSTGRKQMESYLALKYGITLGSTANPLDYLNSSGAAIWSGSSTYQNDVAGLGKESSLYSLDQKVSSSINVSSGTSSRVVMATDEEFSSGNLAGRSSLADGQFLIWGHDGGATSTWVTEGSFDRVSRTWRTQNTNGTGAVYFQIDLGSYPSLPVGKNYQLLVDDDGNFANGGTSGYDLTNSSGTLYTTSVAFPSGTSYFSIGYLSNSLTVTCPGDQTGMLGAGCGFILPDYTISATTAGGVGTVTLSQSPVVGTTITTSTLLTITAVDEWGNSDNCTLTVTVSDQTSPTIVTDPSPATAGCVGDLPVVASYADFAAQGGEATDNCTAQGDLQITYVDVISTSGGCSVTRTYTVSDQASPANTATCEQVFTITDNTSPVIDCGGNLQISPNNSDCSATHSITPAITENCGFVFDQLTVTLTPSITYNIDPADYTLTADFPLGVTTVEWSVTDECGHTGTCSQTVEVRVPLTDIGYDDGSGSTGIGSGVQPMQTSTHEYFVDGKTAESGYTYSWRLLENNAGSPGAEVNPSYYTINQINQADVSITFAAGIPATGYFVSVIKTPNAASCTKEKTLQVTVQENSSFDVAVENLADQCQSPGSGTSTYYWNITFPSISTEPFWFDYTITIDGSTAVSGTIDNIRSTNTWSLTPSSGTLPLVQTSKAAPYVVVLYFTITNVPANDLNIGISIDASDNYQVSEPNVTNNTDSFNAFKIPTISFN